MPMTVRHPSICRRRSNLPPALREDLGACEEEPKNSQTYPDGRT